VLESRRQQADLAAALGREGGAQAFRTIQTAMTPGEPIEPNRRRCVAIGLLLGALLGLGAAILLEITDESIRSVAELQALLDVPVLAEIPDLHRARVRGTARV
jgi:capsular polysaccharide biosynthesis protein